MTDPKTTRRRLKKNMNLLREREAKWAGNAPLELLNQIEDHEKALRLTEQALAGDLTEADWREALKPLLVDIRDRSEQAPETCGVTIIAGGDVSKVQVAHGSNIAQASHGGTATVNVTDQRGQQVSGDQYNAGRDIIVNQVEEEPPFWKRLSRVQLVLAIVFSLIGTTAAVLAVPGVSDAVYSWITPLCDSPAGDDEILIVVATFDEAVEGYRPHEEIRDAIDEATKTLNQEAIGKVVHQPRVVIDDSVIKSDDHDMAQTLGNECNASLVIWGTIAIPRVTIKTLNLQQPEQNITRPVYEPIEEPNALNEFVLGEMREQVSFLALFAIGQSYIGEYNDQALLVIERAIESLPITPQPDQSTSDFVEGISQAYTTLGWLSQITKNDNHKAAEYYETALTFSKNDAVALNNLAIVYTESELKDLSRAIANLDQVISLAPDQARGYYNRGNAYYENEDWGKAISDYTTAISLEPNHAKAYYNRGRAYNETKQFDLALDDYKRVIELEPEFMHEAYHSRAKAYAAIGKLEPSQQESYLELALADYKQSTKISPNYVRGLNNYCWTAGILDRIDDEALDACERAVKFSEDDDMLHASIRDSRGLALALTGEYLKAIADFEFYVNWLKERYPSNEAVNKIIAEREAWIEVLETGKSPFNNDTLRKLW